MGDRNVSLPPEMVCVLFIAAASLAALPAGAGTPDIKTVRPDGTPNRAAWMAQGTFGVMTHYLFHPKGDTPEERTADLNRTVDAFDVPSYVKQVKATGADWVIFTLGQTTGYLCSPNAVLDPRAPGMTPKRDLALELAKAIHRAGKRLILYIPSEQNSEQAIQTALRSDQPGYAERYFEFLKAYSLKFGKLCDGWWFDSCGPHDDAYWNAWLTALRAGNPQTAVAFSGAEFCCGGPEGPICKLEDYHAGEIHLLEEGQIRRDFLPPGGDIVVVDQKLRKRGQEARTYMPDGQFIDGVQWHCLLPLDLTFNPAVPNQYCNYTDKELSGFVGAVKSVGGAITINVPIEIETGRIPTDSHAQLVRLGRSMKTAGK
ncbi:MAG: hypothetical protein NT029_08785 [Armatimonadetes bacterium]|nr:hypothetical protein [Armatimonadota bacterium]